jgi:hypothetical protein
VCAPLQCTGVCPVACRHGCTSQSLTLRGPFPRLALPAEVLEMHAFLLLVCGPEKGAAFAISKAQQPDLMPNFCAFPVLYPWKMLDAGQQQHVVRHVLSRRWHQCSVERVCRATWPAW